MKILHILDHYKPHFSGYVFRTNYILKYQKKIGLEPIVTISPKQGFEEIKHQEFDGVRIYNTPQNNFGSTPFVKEVRLMNALQKKIEEVIKIESPDIIHAHSPSLNGIPALRAGKKFGIHVVYEVRAFWEDAAVDHGTFTEHSFRYKASRFIETKLLKQVDALFTICEGLKNEIISRGLPCSKITVIPNCVDTKFFYPSDCDEGIAKKYDFKNKTVFGFIGSLYRYEGIDLLIDAFQKVLQKRNDMKLLLVGDGPQKNALYDKAEKMGLRNHVIFMDKVPHEDIKKYYSVMDVLVYPRRKIRLTELVTPLKPLEAMAMGKVVVGSNVGGIRELISHDKDGFLFEAGDADNLAKLLTGLASDGKDFSEISKSAIETVQCKFRWELSVKKYLPVYEKLTRTLK